MSSGIHQLSPLPVAGLIQPKQSEQATQEVQMALWHFCQSVACTEVSDSLLAPFFSRENYQFSQFHQYAKPTKNLYKEIT